MKVLFIGGTGTISTAVTELALAKGIDLTLYNRGSGRAFEKMGARYIEGDINDAADAKEKLRGLRFDSVVDWIGFVPAQVRRDYDLFRGNVGQFVYISSASVYRKPMLDYKITESTPRGNIYWQYSRDKIASEDFLMEKYFSEGFPVTVVRPSHTYGKQYLPFAFSFSQKGDWPNIDRLLRGKPVVVHGDGTSLWTLTYNSDFAKGFVGLLGNPKTIGEAYNITSDEAISWNNIIKTTAQALGVEPNIVHIPSDYIVKKWPDCEGTFLGDKSESVVFDNSKIKAVSPEFICTTPYYLGVRKVLDYYERHPELKMTDEGYDRAVDAFVDKFMRVYED